MFHLISMFSFFSIKFPTQYPHASSEILFLDLQLPRIDRCSPCVTVTSRASHPASASWRQRERAIRRVFASPCIKRAWMGEKSGAISQVSAQVCPLPFAAQDLTLPPRSLRYTDIYVQYLNWLRVGGNWCTVATCIYMYSVMHGVPFRRALTPVYKGEITPPAIAVFSELD